MPLTVFASDEQADQPVDIHRWVRLAEAVLAEEGIRGDTEVSLLFVDEATIADLNSRFLGKEGPTDVLSFPIDDEPVEGGRSPDSGGSGPGFSPNPEDAPTLLGDVVICPSVASRNAPDHAGEYDDEMALLVVHGLLHLLGLDHEQTDEAEVMEARELALLRAHFRPDFPELHAAEAPGTAADAASDAKASASSVRVDSATDTAITDASATDTAITDASAPDADSAAGGAPG